MSLKCNEELAYALVTPYSLLKSRTGGILARLLAFSKLELIGARMFAPSDAMVDDYLKALRDQPDLSTELQNALLNYVDDMCRPTNSLGISNRALCLLFKGENAVKQLYDAIGPISDKLTGYTVRGTYGDYVVDMDGKVRYFEPAVLTATDPETNVAHMKILAKYAQSDGGILEHVVKFPRSANVQTTLVIIKPDSFRRPSARPGNIIDIFARTGLFIVGARLFRMTLKEAEEFYGPVRDMFVDRLKPRVKEKIGKALKEVFEFDIDDKTLEALADLLKEKNADCEFKKIVEFMTGVSSKKDAQEAQTDTRCLALLYQGHNAIERIREQLGSTNPEKAETGTVRSIYGYDLMRNGAHASDSPDNAERERRIVGLLKEEGPSEFEELIREYLENCAS